MAAERVAVVIPTKNRPSLFQRAARSALAQVPPPAQLVVVDVGGRATAATDQLAHSTNVDLKTLVAPIGAAPGAARNQGAAATSAEYIAFLDDDDEWMPGYLAGMTRTLGAIECDVVVGQIVLRRGDRREPLPLFRLPSNTESVLLRNPGFTGSNILIRRSTLDHIGGWDPSLSAFNDLDLLIRLLEYGATFSASPESIVEQTIHGDQATAATTTRLAALESYLRKHERLVVGRNRRLASRERHRMLKHQAAPRSHQIWHLALDMAFTSPRESYCRLRRRRRLGGGYD